MKPAIRFLVTTAGILMVCLLSGGIACAADPASFKASVAAVLVDNCIACHGPKKAEGGYRLDTFEQLKTAGDSGEEPIVPGATPGGELLRRIASDDPDERMPPDSPPLSPEAVKAVRDWVAAGAAFDGAMPSDPLWLVMPPRVSAPPATYAFPVPVTALAFSPDGSRLIVGGYHELLVFDAAEGKLVRRIGNVGQRVLAIRFLADGRSVAVAGGEPGREGDVRLVDVENGSLEAVLARSNEMVFDVAPRPRSEELAVATADGVVRVVDASSGAEVRAISSHGDWVTAVAWSDDGARLASASRDKSVKVYDAATGELLANFGDHAAAARGVAFTADGKEVLSTGDDRNLRRWRIETGKQVAAVALSGEAFKPVRDREMIFVPSAGQPVRVVDIAKNAVARAIAAGGPGVTIAVHPASGRIASGSLSGEVRLVNLADGQLVKAWAARP